MLSLCAGKAEHNRMVFTWRQHINAAILAVGCGLKSPAIAFKRLRQVYLLPSFAERASAPARCDLQPP